MTGEMNKSTAQPGSVRDRILWPDDYSAETLRAHNPDIHAFDDNQIRDHYIQYGIHEGRIASDACLRENLISYISPDSRVLEIGPFCDPVFRGPNVRYMDVLDADALRERALAIGKDPTSCPETIHFVGDLAEASGLDFDIIFSSHNLEHQPDLVTHLQVVQSILSDVGNLVLLIPDKRYCFDHFLQETTIPEILEAFFEKRTKHSPRHVIEHIALTCHNDIARHWRGDHGDPPSSRSDLVAHALKHLEISRDIYVDVHAWKFTPQSFRALMEDLRHHGLIQMKIDRVYNTPINRCEFAAVLSLQTQASEAPTIRTALPGLPLPGNQTG